MLAAMPARLRSPGTVTFPAGSTWIDYWNEDTTYAGGSATTYAAPLDRYPLFIRASQKLDDSLFPASCSSP